MIELVILLCLGANTKDCHHAGHLTVTSWYSTEACLEYVEERRLDLNRFATLASINRQTEYLWRADCNKVKGDRT